MTHQFKYTKIVIALLGVSTALSTQAAGLDRSGQDIKGFFNEGTYAEVDYAYIDTSVSGYDHASEDEIAIVGDGETYIRGRKTGNITSDPYSFIRYGVKTDINENVSIGIFYDEPFGAKAEYKGNSNFVSDANQKIVADPSGPLIVDTPLVNPDINDPNYQKDTSVNVHTESWTGLLGLKANGFQIYGGPVFQKAQAEVSLRGNAFGPLTGYEANVNSDSAMGWAAGLAYSKPDIALNAALTYRSEIEHETPVAENVPLLGTGLKNTVAGKLGITDPDLIAAIDANATTDAKVTTPESVNFNFQTGLSREYQLLGTLDVRWVPWSDFKIVPPLYNAYSKASTGKDSKGLPLLDYDKDQWQVDLGLAKRFTDNLAGSIVVGWDSGAGNPITALGPIDGYYSVGGGFKYNVTPEWAISAGGKYLKFGAAKGKLPSGNIVSNFQDNDGYVAGVKISYQSEK